jgi:hypothetical protein
MKRALVWLWLMVVALLLSAPMYGDNAVMGDIHF